MHLIQQEEPSEEFQAAWLAAGKHIQSQSDGGVNWIRADLGMPFIEHLSFRLGYAQALNWRSKVSFLGLCDRVTP